MPPQPSWCMAHHSNFQENLCCKAPQMPLPYQRCYNTCGEQCLAFNVHQLHNMARNLCTSHEHYNRQNMYTSIKMQCAQHSCHHTTAPTLLEHKDKTFIIEQGDKHDTVSINRLKPAYLDPGQPVYTPAPPPGTRVDLPRLGLEGAM